MRRPGASRAAGLALTVAGLALLAACRSGPSDPQPAAGPAPDVVPPASAADDRSGKTDSDLAPLQQQEVFIYYPAADGDGLIGETHQIFLTATPGDRAKQIVADLISGPTSEAAHRALPPGTQLRQIYVLDNGVAYVDFTADLERGIGGGSMDELLTVYSIVDSVALNIAEIQRVGILINGRPIETLNGHLDLRRPLTPDRSLVLGVVDPTIVRLGGSSTSYS